MIDRLLSPELTRSALVTTCKAHLASGLPLTKAHGEVRKLYRQMWRKDACRILTEIVMCEQGCNNQQIEDMLAIIKKDLNSVIPDAAAIAWLTIDDRRLHEEFKTDKTIPHDLAYGLVLKNYPLVMCLAGFLSGFKYEEERSRIPEHRIQYLKEVSILHTKDKLPAIHEDIIYREVEEVLM